MHRFPETVQMLQEGQQAWVQAMKAAGKPIPVYTDWEDGLPEEFKTPDGTKPSPWPAIKGVDAAITVASVAKAPTAPRKQGSLVPTSKAEMARAIMRETLGQPLDTVIEMIMKATGHDKALAKATYKANAARVGITL